MEVEPVSPHTSTTRRPAIRETPPSTRLTRAASARLNAPPLAFPARDIPPSPAASTSRVNESRSNAQHLTVSRHLIGEAMPTL